MIVIAAGGVRTAVNLDDAKDPDAASDALSVTVPAGGGASLLVRAKPGAASAVVVQGSPAVPGGAAPAPVSVRVPAPTVRAEFTVPVGSVAINLPVPSGVTSVVVMAGASTVANAAGGGGGDVPVTVAVLPGATTVTVPVPVGSSKVSVHIPAPDPNSYETPTTAFVIQPVYPVVTAETLGSDVPPSVAVFAGTTVIVSCAVPTLPAGATSADVAYSWSIDGDVPLVGGLPAALKPVYGVASATSSTISLDAGALSPGARYILSCVASIKVGGGRGRRLIIAVYTRNCTLLIDMSRSDRPKYKKQKSKPQHSNASHVNSGNRLLVLLRVRVCDLLRM